MMLSRCSGTWIAPESTPIDRTKSSPSFATPAGLTAPLFLKWMLLFEDPDTHTLWIAKALPRVWLSQGLAVRMDNAPTAYGKITFKMESSIDVDNLVKVNVTISRGLTLSSAAAGGLKIRIRAPSRQQIAAVTLGNGQSWPGFDAALEAIVVSREQLCDEGLLRAFQDIKVTFAS